MEALAELAEEGVNSLHRDQAQQMAAHQWFRGISGGDGARLEVHPARPSTLRLSVASTGNRRRDGALGMS
jgi:hypothetical protein